jgi:transcriptional regulator with XRE-family HTH domain
MQASLAETITAWLQHHGWSVRELARRSGVGQSTLSELLGSGRIKSLGAENLAKVAAALGTTTDALIAGTSPSGTPPPPPVALETLPPVLAAAIRRYGDRLTPQQWARLAGYLAALADENGAQGAAGNVKASQGQEAPETDNIR